VKYIKLLINLYRNLSNYGLVTGYKLFLISYGKNQKKVLFKINFKDTLIKFSLRGKTTDYSVFRQIFEQKSYDFPISFSPDIIVDGGANIGLSTLFFSTKFPDAKVIAVEPDKSNYEVLVENTKNSSNIRNINKALWKENTKVGMSIESNYDKDAVFIDDKIYSNMVFVEGLMISEIISDNGFEKNVILKLDIEGSEKEVFSNSESWINKVRIIIVELHDYIVPGATKTFFDSIAKLNYYSLISGENLIIFFNLEDYLFAIGKKVTVR
jgi:FkbM family methyltransferase